MKCLEYLHHQIRLTEHSPLNETERGAFFEQTRRDAFNQAINIVEADEELHKAWMQYSSESRIKADKTREMLWLYRNEDMMLRVVQKELTELERMASIGRDYEYLSNHEEVVGLPTVEDIQRLAAKRREGEKVTE